MSEQDTRSRVAIKLSGLLLAGALTLLCAAGGFAEDGKSAAAPPQAVTPQQAAFFEMKVRPLLFARCFSCHGDKLQAGGVRLDSRAALLQAAAPGPVITPGDPQKSLLSHVIQYTGEVKMPPDGKLKPEEIALLTEWIKMGAPWPAAKPTPGAAPSGSPWDYVITPAQRQFWAFRPVRKPVLPKVKQTEWVKSPIDRFILARLEKNGLKPAPPADKRTLIRRAYFDLVGLPPTPQQINAFLKDPSPNAFAKVVDGLLASPHYGERWGRHWLDVARYADSNGLDENLAFGNAFRYRDYVIAAFNKDKPYNQFLSEQLAGDLMPSDNEAIRNERLTATGFLCLGAKVLAEQDKPKMVMDIVDEQIDVTSKAFLGLTIACARCHNHKFDPIPTKDYYALAGIFKSTRCMQDLGFVSHVYERPLMTKQLQDRIAACDKTTHTAEAALKTITDRANAELAAELRKNGPKYLLAGWAVSRQPALQSVAEKPERPGDPKRIRIKAVDFNRGQGITKNFDTYGKGIGVINNVQAPDSAEWDVNLPAAGTYQIELRYASGEERPVRLLLNGRVIKESAAGMNTGSFNPEGQRWEAEGLAHFHAGKNTLRIERDSFIPHFNQILLVPAAALAPPGAPAPRSIEEIAEPDGLNPAIVQNFADRLHGVADLDAARKMLTDKPGGLLALPDKPEMLYAAADRQAAKSAQDAVDAAKTATPKPPLTLAVEDGKIEDVRIHIRGSTLNLGDVAPRRFLAVLGGDRQPPIDDKRSGRLELAQWLTRPDHPLTGRVAVNRIWQAHFGVGLVRTADNFGLMGEKPTHPELLDWLAATFVEDGWSMKKLHRRIMLSSAYQMSSEGNKVTAAKAETTDPDNRQIWRMNRVRLDAEAFRDAMLAVSGKLDATMGGSLLTSNDNDYVTNDQSGNAAQYGSPRRSIYLPVIRNALFDMFQAFDFGDPSTTHASRASTTVAPQALYVMNSPFAMDASQHFAQEMLKHQAASDRERLRAAYLNAYGRPPSPSETQRALDYLTRYAARLTPGVPEAAKRREMAWKSLCQILMASNEFIYVN